MATKKYTLYFKGQNKYEKEYSLPIISLSLKLMDRYTSNYSNYSELYRCLPKEVRNFIKTNISYNVDLRSNNDLKNCFFITDDDFTPIMDVVFSHDVDILFLNTKELTESLVNEQMSPIDFRRSYLKSKRETNLKYKYDFFKYLCETYVKNFPVESMIDTYDAKLEFPNLNKDELLIASIATDRTNLLVLAKKLGQYLESRRNLAFALKKLHRKLNVDDFMVDSEMINSLNDDLDPAKMLSEIKENLEKFQKKYFKEYEKC